MIATILEDKQWSKARSYADQPLQVYRSDMIFWRAVKHHTVPQEISLIMALCRLRENPDLQFAQDWQAINWQLFVELAGDHKLAGALYSTLKTVEDIQPPALVFESLKQSHDANVIRSLAQEAAIEDIAKLLGSQGIRVLFFKGLVTAKVLHPNTHMAGYSSDIDIYVDPHDLQNAITVLSSNGYLASPKNFDLISPNVELLMQMHHSVLLTSEIFGTEVDLHYQLLQNQHWFSASFNELFERRETVQLGKTNVCTLGATDLAAYLCCHAVDHNCYKLKWIDDAALSMQGANKKHLNDGRFSSPDQVSQKAIDHARHLIESLFPVHPEKNWPNNVITKDRNINRMVRAATKNELDEPQGNIFSYGLARFNHFLQRCLIGGSRAAIWKELFLSLSSPDDVKALGWSKNWKPLYMLIGPVFIVKRFLNRTNEQPDNPTILNKETGGR